MPNVIPSDERTLLLRFQALLMDGLGLGEEAVRVIACSPLEVDHFVAPRDVLLRFGGSAADAQQFASTGRFHSLEAGALEATFRTRCDLDEAGSHKVGLTDADLGHYAFRRDAVNVLADALEDADLNVILWRPVRPVKRTFPESDKKGRGWVWSQIYFAAEFAEELDQE